ncbi:hypothetical protein [Oceanicoccus sp. KOV_DT_Chl]|uniref:hypothetical protein n=1 Tax=Oceanicoccus sp. KOV_DT_Chl TaxID=1904639 RepID=UPI000C79A138|nr:hypothetical protein [Oceanicoccus sp. KOV_DT_Chl]
MNRLKLFTPSEGDFWVSKNTSFIKKTTYYCYLIVGLAVLGALSILFGIKEFDRFTLIIVTMMLVFFTAIYFIVRTVSQSIKNIGVGVSRDHIILRNNKGDESRFYPSEIKYTTRMIIDGNVVISMMGSPQVGYLFDRDELQKWVLPRLKEAEKLSEMALMKLLWKIRHPSFMYTVYLCVPVLCLIAYDLFK